MKARPRAVAQQAVALREPARGDVHEMQLERRLALFEAGAAGPVPVP